MSKYITYQLLSEAVPMTLGEAIQHGISQGYINTKTQTTEGYKVTLYKKYVLWLPKEVFDRYFLKADTDEALIMANTVYKHVMAEEIMSKINKEEVFREECVSTNAALQLEFLIAARDSIHSLRFCETVDLEDDKVRMSDLSFWEADMLMNAGFAVRNVSWIQSQYFIVKQMITYNPSYFARNEKFPVSQTVMEVLTQLSDTCTAENQGTYRIVDIETGAHLPWDGRLSETEGLWEVVY